MTPRPSLASLLFVLAVLAVISPAGAREVETAGTGRDRVDAILAALEEAVSQVNGIAVDATTNYAHSAREALQASGATFTSDLELQRHTRTATRGVIASWTLLSERPAADGRGVTVRLRADVAVYDPRDPRDGERLTLAVIPFRVPDGTPVAAGDAVATSASRALASTRVLRILDRQYTREAADEFRRIASDSPISERVKLHQRLAADYLLVGTVTHLQADTIDTVIEYTGERIRRTTARATVAYRVINLATGQITDDGSIAIETAVASIDIPSAHAALLDEAGLRVGRRTLDVIDPIRIAHVDTTVSPELIYLNQGKGRLSVGDRLTIDALATTTVITDPTTGRSLGPAVAPTATLIEVTRVLPQYAICRLVRGTSDTVLRSAICHPVR